MSDERLGKTLISQGRGDVQRAQLRLEGAFLVSGGDSGTGI